MLRKENKKGRLIIPSDIPPYELNKLLDTQYKKHWHVNCAKPHKSAKKDIDYLGRYIKRTPIANSRLSHYNGEDMMSKFLNHKTGKEEFFHCDIFDFIDRFTQHVPERHFRMRRYYSFLSNYHRGKLLPIINKLFDRETPTAIKMTWRFLYKRTFGHSPTDCVLRNSKLKLAFLCIGVSSFELKTYHHLLAQNKPNRY